MTAKELDKLSSNRVIDLVFGTSFTASIIANSISSDHHISNLKEYSLKKEEILLHQW